MTNFTERPIIVGGSILDRVSLGQDTIQIRLALEDGIEKIILNLYNVYYLPNSPLNLISLSLFNYAGIYYDNNQQALYDKTS